MRSRTSRRRLLLSTTMLMGALTSYGGRAYGQVVCIQQGMSSNFVCDNFSDDTQTITADNAAVTTTDDFVIDTTVMGGSGGDAVVIMGDGAISYEDDNASPLTAVDNALEIQSDGDDGTILGSVIVYTNGDLQAGGFGILASTYGDGGIEITTGADSSIEATAYTGLAAVNFGDGSVVVDANGSVTSTNGTAIVARNIAATSTSVTITTGAGAISGGVDGIYAGNGNTITPGGTDLTIATGSGAVSGGDDGIEARNFGSGAISITTGTGAVTGGDDGIQAYNSDNSGYGISITTGAGTVQGGGDGIDASNSGSGAISITANGAVTGGDDGIDAFNSSDSGYGISITTGAGDVQGGDAGIDATNFGSGALTISTGAGAVTGTNYDGIIALNSGAYLAITTGAGAVMGGADGIEADNVSGALTITVNGDVSGGGDTNDDGIDADNSSSATSLTITTAAGTTVSGGGDGIRARNFGAGALTITANGAVTGTDYDGINAFNSSYGTDLTITTGAGLVSGGEYGIYAKNYGAGALTITTGGGDVTGGGIDPISGLPVGYDGIFAQNGVSGTPAGQDITITTATGTAVTGARYGIFANNFGYGSIDIEVNGSVDGAGDTGIFAYNYSSSAGGIAITTGMGSSVTGADEGIVAQNNGAGGIVVDVAGAVAGTTGDGVYAYNSDNSTSGIEITTGAGAVSGAQDGIDARNYGSGAITIATGSGAVSGGAPGDGIYAVNSDNSGYGIAITTGSGAVSAYNDAIQARNYGAGALTITTTGDVTATGGSGIYAFNGPDSISGLSIITGDGAISGGGYGIYANNFGDGALTIDVSGAVTGNLTGTNSPGIRAYNSTNSYYGITITTGPNSSVAGYDGIYAGNEGDGALVIDTDGSVTGDRYGIYARNSGGDLIIVTGPGAVTGGVAGIRAQNFTGTEEFNITVGGEVSGGSVGIIATNNSTGEPIVIANLAGGSISAASNLAIDVDATAAYADISNAGLITGLIDLTSQDDLFTNNDGGAFDAIGVSDFGDGYDVFTNESGGVVGTPDDPAVQAASFINLELFDNAGAISLTDGQEGDSFTISGNFSARSGSTLMVDTFLGGPGSTSDTLTIEGNVSGLTGIVVNDSNSGPGAAGAVIPIVFVEGDVSSDAFELANGPIDKGFFQYDLFFRPTGSGVFELRSVGIEPTPGPGPGPGPGPEPVPAAGPGAMLLPQLLTASQDIWHQTSDTWFDRSADLRAFRWHGYSTAALPGATPPGTHAAPRPLTAGVWARGSHADLDRDDRVTTTSMGRDFRFDLDRELDVSDVQSGIDAPLRGVFNPHDVLILSVFGGGVWAGLDYDALSRRFDYDGGQVGAAATYLSGSWFVDALFNAQFLDLEAKALGFPDKDLDAETYGFRVDTGYRIGGKYFLEPLLTLAYADSDLEGFTFAGNTVSFEAGDSLRGRIGLRAGVTWLMGGLRLEPFVIGSYWGELDDDDNRAKLVSNGFRFDLKDHSEDEWGEVSLGANLFTAGNHAISAFSKVDIIFGDDTEGYAASGGLRWQW